MLRLYCAPWSTNVERVALALAHKGLGVERVWIDYADRAPVIAVSGQPPVPVLEHDGQVVSDSLRILRYLEQRWPQPPLFPEDPVQAARVSVFLEWFDGVWKGPPNAIAAELERGAGADPGAVVDRLGDGCAAGLGVFEDLLGAGRLPLRVRLRRRRLRGVPVPEVRRRASERRRRVVPPRARARARRATPRIRGCGRGSSASARCRAHDVCQTARIRLK